MSSYDISDDLYAFFDDVDFEEMEDVVNYDEIREMFGVNYSDEQGAIVTWMEENPLVVASCAGSGKTTTIISNILYKQLNKVNGNNILCITYTAEASRDMKKRYTEMVQGLYKNKRPVGNPYFGTFHAFFKRVIESFLNGGKRFDVLTDGRYNHKLCSYIRNYSDRQPIEILNDMFSFRGKQLNELISLDGITNVTVDEQETGFSQENYVKVIRAYEDLKKKDGLVDFEDMQIMLYNALKEDDELSKKIISWFKGQYRHIYIDEYQDINPIQKEIMDKLMDDDARNLVVIGDDSQAIYSFRGSSPEFIMNFQHSYLGAEVLKLSMNYRSTKEIIDPIKTSIIRNKYRLDTEINANKTGGSVSTVTGSGVDIYLNIANKMKDFLEDVDKEDYRDVAILVRNNAEKVIIADALIEQKIQVNIKNMVYSLRNHKVYKDTQDLIDMVDLEDNLIFKDYARRIFPQLKPTLIEKYDVINNDTINWYEDVVLNNIYGLPAEKLNSLRKMKETEEIREKLIGAWELLLNNYKRMDKSGYISLTKYQEAFDYILTLSGNLTVEEFRALEQRKDRMLNACAKANYGVQINTFHGSKGLEYDSEVMFGVNNSIIPNVGRINALVKKGKFREAEQHFEEERRLFYVAWTRPERNLIVVYDDQDPSIFLSEVEGVEGLNYKEETSILDILEPENIQAFKRYQQFSESR